ncbi:zinc ribbon domain-containing protein [Butyrivibrio sp. MB2005]|uniref:zinc ribbon domain-containing protein n=1 Tax=Butyrivibrio sp. MB2005 TaxID=1280678 RepID=UPI000402D803|nr:zinc ribbon domain-containing protein [Butyrivibrio sp. MB2005]
MQCIYCGKEISDNSKFCPKCGKELKPKTRVWPGAADEKTANTQMGQYSAGMGTNPMPDLNSALGSQKVQNQIPSKMIIAIGIGVVLVIVLIAVLIVSGGKRNSGNAEPVQEDTTIVVGEKEQDLGDIENESDELGQEEADIDEDTEDTAGVSTSDITEVNEAESQGNGKEKNDNGIENLEVDEHDTTVDEENTIPGYMENLPAILFSVRVAAPDGYVNFRDGAGTDYYIITPYNNGTILDVIDLTEVNGKTWYQCIDSLLQIGWVASSQVETISANNTSSGNAANYVKYVSVENKSDDQINQYSIVRGVRMDGKAAWQYITEEYPGAELNSASVCVNGEHVYIIDENTYIRLNKQTGETEAKNLFTEEGGISGAIMAADDNMNLYAMGYYDNYLYKFSKDGSIVWMYDFMDEYYWPLYFHLNGNELIVTLGMHNDESGISEEGNFECSINTDTGAKW